MEMFNSFLPSTHDLVDNLIVEYNKIKARIEELSTTVVDGLNSTAIKYFLSAYGESQRKTPPNMEDLFDTKTAVAYLNSTYWKKTFDLTDLKDCMPAHVRKEWDSQINAKQCPEFDESVVRATMQEMMNNRYRFFCERVDGVFRALSGDHVTNRPEGFSKRMIFWVNQKSDEIHDLRHIIAKIQGYERLPTEYETKKIIDIAYQHTGQWVTIDGGALRIRTYLKGTCHFEVNPDLAFKLNIILASLYPMAIPSEFREKPKKQLKDFKLFSDVLPFEVTSLLLQLESVKHTPYRNSNREIVQPVTTNSNSFRLPLYYIDNNNKALIERVYNVLERLGGIRKQKGLTWFEFDYNAKPIINEVAVSGIIPDIKAHQFYPTPDELSEEAARRASEKGKGGKWFEPSAGIGHLADACKEFADSLDCVEISALHCEILKTKGYNVLQADFLSIPPKPEYNRIVMNPPFSEGRWQAHVTHAANFLAEQGRLVAILPASAKDKFFLPGFICQYSEIYDNKFEGTGINVVILVADKA